MVLDSNIPHSRLLVAALTLKSFSAMNERNASKHFGRSCHGTVDVAISIPIYSDPFTKRRIDI